MLIGIYISHYPIYNLIYLLDTLNNLAMSGCEIDLYLQNAGHKLPEFGPNINLVVLPFNYVSAAHSRVAPYYSLIPAVNLEIIRKAAPKRKYDYCIGIEPMGLIMAKEAADAANCPLGYLSYELYERSNPGVWGNDFEIIKEVERRIVPELDLFLIQDTAREEAYYRLLNAEGRPKNVIYFPVSLGPVKSSNKPNYWREKYGLSPDTKIALYFGQLGKSRFIDQMIINAKRFSPDIVLIIKAWVSGKNEYFDYLRSLDTSGRVIFDTREISWDERWELIASADAGVVFYRNDLINDYLTGRASDKTAAYMQSGIPVVCPDYPTFQEVVDHYHNGVCVNDFSGLPGALDEIFNNYEVFKSGARKAFNEVYDSSKYIDKILNHIKTGTGSTILSSEGELKYSNENLSKGLNEIKRAADEGRNERGQAIFKKLLVDFPNNETLLNIYQNNSFSLTWDDIKTFTEVNLYAGDIPESDRYRGRIGISIEKTDFRHIYHDVTQHFPLPDNSVDSFQAEDVFEHIAYEKLPAVFNEIYRVLKPGATFRLSIPDYGCDILIDRSLKDTDGKIIFDPGGGGTIENPGHVWLPLFSNVKPLLEKTKFAEAGKIEFLHHYNSDGTFVLKDIDYSKGFVKRNPDNDERVQNPRRPMSIIVDLVKDDSIEPEKSLDEIAEDIYPNDIYSRIEIEIANKNYDASKELCYQVLSEDPDNYKTYLYMGDINAAESDDLKALHNYESAYKLSNNGRAAGLKLAQIYHSKGDGARLKKVMDKLAADYPDDRTILKLYQALNVDPDSGKNEIPVILITYNRPDHTARVIDSLRIHNVQNLFVFSDAPKTKKDDEGVRLTRDLIKTIDWTIPEIVYQKENQGLAKSIISAVDYVFTKFDKVILLEDDCVPQKYFFDFMTRCLNQYENNEKIYGVSGYSVPVPDSILKNYSHDLYFYPRIGSWGWGTWKDRWRKKEDDLKKLLTQLNERKIDIGRYGNDILQTIVGLVNGNVKDVWTINWLLTVYLNEGFYIYPTKSHIMNIGMDGTGVHCGKTDKYDIKAADKLPESYPENVVLDERIMGNFRKYYDLNYDSVATNKGKSNKLKVVHLCAADFGGAGKAAYRLHKGLLSAGVDSTLITAIKNSNDPSVKVLPEHASNGTAECGNPPSYQSKLMNDNYTRWWGQLNEYPDRSKSIELFTDTKSSFNLEAVKGIAEADIINFHWVAGLLDYEKIADVFKGKKIVWTLHDMNPFTGGCHYSHGCEKFRSGCGDCPLLNSGTVNDLSKKIFKTKEEAYKKLNIHLVTPSKWLGKEAKISKLFTAFPLTVIPNGFPVEVFSNGDKREIRRKLGIPEHSNVILFGADNVVNERKGFIYLLQALSKLNINENIVLVTFGKLEAQLNFNGKFKHIDLGPISNENDLSTIYNLADVFMLPSLQDNLPNTAVEAMLCGTPVVAFNTGGLSDIIEHKKNGYLAELKNVDDLAGGVIWALKNNSESLSAYCRKTAEDKFSIEIQAKKYLALYENILSGADDNITSHPASNYKNITFDEKKAEEKRVTGNLPIVLVNLGDNDHLKYTLAQAKIKNPGSDVYLICEPNKDNYDYAIHEDINKYSGKAFKFQKYYKHYSTNVHNIEMFCFLRWFILEEFMAAHNFEKCVYIDSDVLLYKNISEEAENFNRYDFTLSNGQSPHTAFVNNFVFLKEFNEYLFECYTNDEWHKQSKQYFEQRISNGEPGGFCDMTLFSDFTRLGKFNVGDISEIVNDGRFDHNINVAEDFETEKGIKKIYWSDGKPFCKNKETGKFIEFKSLHFQGTAKNSVNQYFHGKIEISEESGKWKISDNSIKVSAIVSTYNSERFLRGCLDDLTTQTLYQKSELEIIVVNSGSEQNEEKIVEEYKSRFKNIKYLKTERETIYQAWNRGIKAAGGKYVTNANTDDRHRKDALEVLANELDKDENIGLVYSDQYVTKTENQSFESREIIGQFDWPEFDRTQLIHCACVGPQPMWRRSLHDRFGYFNETLKVAGDYEWWLRISEYVKLKHIAQKLGLYLLSEGSVEHEMSDSMIKETIEIRKHFAARAGLNNLDYNKYKATFLTLIDSSQPLVSVIIPTYNRREKLVNAIKSTLSQTYQNFEVIVVNDGGENVSDIIKQLNDPRIKLITFSKHKGVSAARNAGIKATAGEYIALLDDDDLFYSDHLSTALNHLNEKHEVIYTRSVRISYREINGKYVQDSKTVPYSIEYDRNKLLVGNISPINCFVFKKSLTDKAGLFDESLPVLEDWEFWLRLSSFTDFKHIKKNTVQVNWYNDGSTLTSSKQKEFGEARNIIYKKYEDEINQIPNLNEIISEFNAIWNNDNKADSPKASIIALSYNQPEYTLYFINSVLKYTNVPFEIIIIDNGSGKETVDALKQIAENDERIKVVFNSENLGFPAGVNQGLKLAAGNYTVIANNDIIVTEGWLERMTEVAESDENIGIVGPISNSVSGVQLDKEAAYNTIEAMHQYASEIKKKNSKQTFAFPRVAFLCTLIKKEVIEKLGGLDERFSPGNFEDDDYCLRAQIAGYKTVVAKDVFIHHFGSKSFTAEGTKKYAERLEINKEIFVEKWGADPEEIWLHGKSYLNKSIVVPLEDDEFAEKTKRAQLNVSDKEYTQALANLKIALSNIEKISDQNINEKLPAVFHLAGKICLMLGKNTEAGDFFNKELQIQPNSERAAEALKSINAEREEEIISSAKA